MIEPADLLYFLQQCLNAVQVGSFYGLLAVAYVLVYAISGRINLAFGAIAMWGGQLVVIGMLAATVWTPFALPGVLITAVLAALAGTTLIGTAAQFAVIRPLVTRPSLAILIATIGLAIVLEELSRIASDSRENWIRPVLNEPAFVLRSTDFVVQMSVMRAVVLAAAVFLSAALVIFIARHPFGRRWRACCQDMRMAALCGIDTDRTLATTFALAAAYAAAAGIIVALYYGNVSFYMGLMLGLKALLAAVVGGFGSVTGALIAAYLLATAESLWSAYFAANYRDVTVFGLLLAVMILRPRGLLTMSERPDERGRP